MNILYRLKHTTKREWAIIELILFEWKTKIKRDKIVLKYKNIKG